MLPSTITLEAALQASQESETLDFKESLDVESKGEWLELIKDLIAMANSGGGIILVGLLDNGKPSGSDIAPMLVIDPADLTNKIFAYTGQHFSELRISATSKEDSRVAAIEVGCVAVPVVFNKVGNYQSQNQKPKSAFSAGCVYFRHGAKSEPCTSEDLRKFLQREVEAVKQFWLGGIRKVVEAPDHSQILVFPPSTQVNAENSFRPTDNPDAPKVRLSEAAALDIYPLTYRELTDMLSSRYKNFVENGAFHQLRKSLTKNSKYARERPIKS